MRPNEVRERPDPDASGDPRLCEASLDKCPARSDAGAVPIRVGIDLVSTSSVEEALHAHGDRYLARVYAAREIEDCRTGDGVDAECLAGRFAAKEATLKVLPAGDEGLALTTIEVRRAPSGPVHIELSGRAAELAQEAGVTDLALSITHEGGFAAAVVVAELRAHGTGESRGAPVRTSAARAPDPPP
jgi:holo-[acyl-carrier protein] synthase